MPILWMLLDHDVRRHYHAIRDTGGRYFIAFCGISMIPGEGVENVPVKEKKCGKCSAGVLAKKHRYKSR
jgi:hypothetical protein